MKAKITVYVSDNPEDPDVRSAVNITLEGEVQSVIDLVEKFRKTHKNAVH